MCYNFKSQAKIEVTQPNFLLKENRFKNNMQVIQSTVIESMRICIHLSEINCIEKLTCMSFSHTNFNWSDGKGPAVHHWFLVQPNMFFPLNAYYSVGSWSFFWRQNLLPVLLVTPAIQWTARIAYSFDRDHSPYSLDRTDNDAFGNSIVFP